MEELNMDNNTISNESTLQNIEEVHKENVSKIIILINRAIKDDKYITLNEEYFTQKKKKILGKNIVKVCEDTNRNIDEIVKTIESFGKNKKELLEYLTNEQMFGNV